MDGLKSGQDVKARERDDTGKTTGSAHSCQLEGCRGLRISVKWEDGKHTFPCSRGMAFDDATETWQIL